MRSQIAPIAKEMSAAIPAITSAAAGGILVDEFCRTNAANIFAIGDCAACPLGEGRWVPPRAQSAHQMASHVCRNLLALLKGKPLKDFQYRDFGSLISRARFGAVGSLMRGKSAGPSLFIEGMLARFFYVSLYRMHQRVLHGSFKTTLKVIVDGINSMLRPSLKLH